MPTLDWIGKKAVLNHHNEVLFHLLRKEPGLSGKSQSPCGGRLKIRIWLYNSHQVVW
jgi:hypothetical protein